MKGRHKVIVQNNRLHYEFEIRRNITIIQGNSATGKTTLVNMIRQAANLGPSSGIDVFCDVPCRTLEGVDWKLIVQNASQTIFFIDEENSFVHTEEFAAAIKESDNYVVLITRENLHNLPYSVEEIYGLHSSGKYQNTKRVYQEMYNIYSKEQQTEVNPDKIIVEDSNSGYNFFQAVCTERGVVCESANGKSNIFQMLKNTGEEEVCVIADGAAIGSEMEKLYKQIELKRNIKLYLPESFEWIILQSGIIVQKEVQAILEQPENYIDSKEYFSWERYFTKLLMTVTEGTYLQYKKSKLNNTYLHKKNKQAIINSMEGLKFKECP